MALQPSSGTLRERWVKSLLPAAIIIMVYMVFINVSANRQISKLTDRVEDRRETAVSEGLVQSLQVRQQSLLRQQGTLEEKMDLAESDLQEQANRISGDEATDRMSQINQLCKQLSIGVLNQEPTTQIQLSDVRKNALALLKKLTPERDLQYQRLELVGEYANMVALMQKLPETVSGIIPLGMELIGKQSSPSSNQRLPAGQRIWRVFVLM